MTTFSQVVDKMLIERRRPDLQDYVVSSLNQAVRLAHSAPSTGSNTMFEANRHEDKVIVNSISPFIWPIPNYTRFNRLEAAFSSRHGEYLKQRTPQVSRKATDSPFSRLFWYQSGPTIAFSGMPDGDEVLVSYFLYPRNLAYKVPADRRVIHNEVTDQYELVNPQDDLLEALEEETHWMLQRWTSMLEQGVRAAIFRHLGDLERSRLAYSAFESERLYMHQLEAKVALT